MTREQFYALLFFQKRFRLPFRVFATMLEGNGFMVALRKRIAI